MGRKGTGAATVVSWVLGIARGLLTLALVLLALITVVAPFTNAWDVEVDAAFRATSALTATVNATVSQNRIDAYTDDAARHVDRAHDFVQPLNFHQRRNRNVVDSGHRGASHFVAQNQRLRNASM